MLKVDIFINKKSQGIETRSPRSVVTLVAAGFLVQIFDARASEPPPNNLKLVHLGGNQDFHIFFII